MEKLIINDEECRVIKDFTRYCVSESGKMYRHVPINMVEQAILDNGAEFVHACRTYYRKRKAGKSQPYCSITSDEGVLSYLPIAAFVAESFGLKNGKFDRKKDAVIFKDGNNQNLHYTNFEVKEKPKGAAKLLKKDVAEIKKLLKQNITLKEIAARYGVSDMQINRIKTGENWGNGKRKILAPQAPFHIKDGKVRKYIAIFNQEPAPPEIRRPFIIRRNENDPTDNTILGILKGYKLTLKHKNITRAKVNVEKLNEYFFENKVEKPITFDAFFKR